MFPIRIVVDKQKDAKITRNRATGRKTEKEVERSVEVSLCAGKLI